MIARGAECLPGGEGGERERVSVSHGGLCEPLAGLRDMLKLLEREQEK
jgi:hypothetical protein